MLMGKKASSEDLSCHFRSGAGALARKAREGSRTSSTLAACEALFRLGCTLYLKSWFCGASLKQTRSAFAVSSTVTWNCPVHVISPSKPPSTWRSAEIFSSISTFTGSSSGFTAAAATGSGASPTASPGAVGAMSAGSPKISPGRFFVKAMPFFVITFGLIVAAPESSAMDVDQGGEDSCTTLGMLAWAWDIVSWKLIEVGPEDGAWLSLPKPVFSASFGARIRAFFSSICFFFAISRASFILLCSII
mmetsp:Transcript_75555/g.161907  ORF Transcript_75555/g.161907 Transcript_75555/m.161907 type:complete len:248 (+) Transcript_75555:533-1276(+)